MNRLEAHKLKKTARPLVALAFAGFVSIVERVAAYPSMSQPWKLNIAAFKRFKGSRLARSPQCCYVVASRPSLGRYRLLERELQKWAPSIVN